MPEDPAILFYNAAWKAMLEGDRQRLEELTHLSPFPCGTDGWVGNHWLSTAVDTGNLTTIKWVLSKGPDVNHMIGGTSALTSALQLEGDCQLREKNPTSSPEAAANLTIQIIDLLLQAGADINLRDAFDSSALHKAAAWSSPTVLKHLLLRGADPFAVEDESAPSQPLDYAIKSKRPEIAAILRDAMERRSSSKGPTCPP